ncbi:transcriptional regulator [Leifsonia sp. LS1]|uniref:ROK family protein n=1 Tax=Leifsonia sp. LS1 TaxID=2828483 RepID=UPI001CFDB833|nr:ROK family protein [Leifsonia sp. LS1]GIT81192.1 transcriptional regulator [Leifsonia sp. LS1]
MSAHPRPGAGAASSVDGRAGVVVGIDIGGTKTAAALVRPDGRLAHRVEAPTPASQGAEAILDTVAALAAETARRAGGVPAAYGVGSAGGFDEHGTVVHSTDHLAGWSGTDVAGGLRARLGAPVAVVNDVHAAALGEQWAGAPDGFLFVAVGTGIGGAVVSDGRLLRGASGMAGSVGHVRIPSSRRRICSCGGVDHVEAFASGPGIELTYAEFSARSLGLREIGRLARGGDVVAAQVIRLAAEELGESLAASVVAVDPGTVLIGGGVSGLGELFVGPLAERLRASLRPPFSAVQVTVAHAGPDAALVGAGRLALAASRSAEVHDVAPSRAE